MIQINIETAHKMFNQMMETIAEQVVLYTLKVQVQIRQMSAEDVAKMEKEKLQI